MKRKPSEQIPNEQEDKQHYQVIANTKRKTDIDEDELFDRLCNQMNNYYNSNVSPLDIFNITNQVQNMK